MTCRNHLLVIGGIDLASLAASAASEAQLETELKRLVVLAPESARESRAQILDELEEAGGDSRSTSSSATPPATRASSWPEPSGRGRSC